MHLFHARGLNPRVFLRTQLDDANSTHHQHHCRRGSCEEATRTTTRQLHHLRYGLRNRRGVLAGIDSGEDGVFEILWWVDVGKSVEERLEGLVVEFAGVTHRSSFPSVALSFLIPSRTRVFAVPSGTPVDSASSAWLNPPKKASRTAVR